MFCTVKENHICGAKPIKLPYIFGILVYARKRRKNILGDTHDDSRATPPRSSTSDLWLLMFRSNIYKKVIIIEAKSQKVRLGIGYWVMFTNEWYK